MYVYLYGIKEFTCDVYCRFYDMVSEMISDQVDSQIFTSMDEEDILEVEYFASLHHFYFYSDFLKCGFRD